MSTNTKGIYYSTSADAPITEEARSLALANSVPVGPNYIINGGFDFWQRGTSFTPATSALYNADRFFSLRDGSGATVTVSREAFTVGSAPVAGYEGTYYYRYNQSVAGAGGTYSNILMQRIEDVRTLAGQTATVSFWAKADTARTVRAVLGQHFGTGGTPSATNNKTVADFSVTTSWQRFSGTVALDSLTGKTLGTDNNHSVQLIIQTLSLNTTQTIDIWGVQVERGSMATPFRRNAPSIQAELAACQRYFQTCYMQARGYGTVATVDTGASSRFTYPVTMRVSPTITQTGVSKSGSPAGYDSFFEGADASGVTYTYRHGNASGSGGLYYTVTWTANAEL